MKKIILACQKCGGVLEADASKTVLFCPYCGDRTLLVESDAVKIATLEADVEKFKIQSNENIKMAKVNKSIGHKFIDFLHEKEETKQRELEIRRIEEEKSDSDSTLMWVTIMMLIIMLFAYMMLG